MCQMKLYTNLNQEHIDRKFALVIKSKVIDARKQLNDQQLLTTIRRLKKVKLVRKPKRVRR